MSNAPDWATRALDRGLTAGRKMRLDCACGEGRTLLVTHGGDAIRGYCFRSKSPLFHKLELSFSERLALVQATQVAEHAAAASLELPGPLAERLLHPHDWPAEARVWLYDAGLNDDLIRAWGIYWLPRMSRVVLPLNGGTAWVARSVDRHKTPKYLFPEGFKRGLGVWFDGIQPDRIVITEDILSAYRINAATGYETCCLLGTSAAGAILYSLRQSAVTGTRIVTWLDGDEWGRKGAAAIRQKLARYDVACANVCTERDPKLLTDEEIINTLNKEAS